jgi:hypothetical protein
VASNVMVSAEPVASIESCALDSKDKAEIKITTRNFIKEEV